MDSEKKLYGVGGWLQFFIFALMWIGPVRTVLGQISMFSNMEVNNPDIVEFSLWTAYKIVAWSYIIIGIYFQWKAALKLKHVFKEDSVAYVKKLLLYYPIVGYFIDIIFLSFIFNDVPYISLLIGYTLSPIVWYIYFSKSKRVKNTYFNNEIVNISK